MAKIMTKQAIFLTIELTSENCKITNILFCRLVIWKIRTFTYKMELSKKLYPFFNLCLIQLKSDETNQEPLYVWSKVLIFKRAFHKLKGPPHLCLAQIFWPLMRAFKWGTIKGFSLRDIRMAKGQSFKVSEFFGTFSFYTWQFSCPLKNILT